MLGLDPKAARATWTVILILLLCLTIYAIRETLFIFVVALLFAYLLAPLVDFIDHALPTKSSRTLALAIVYACLVGAMVFAVISIGSSVAEQAQTLAQSLSDYLKPDHVRSLPLPQILKPFADAILEGLHRMVQENYEALLQKLPQTIMKALGAASGIIFLIIVPILSFFFLKDGRALQRSLVGMVDDALERSVLREIAKDLNVLLAQYMRALVLLGLSAAISYGAFFSIIGVPYPVLLASLAFPLEFIPMLGPASAAAMVLLVSAFSGFHHMLALAIFLAVYRIIQDYVISPHLMSAGMELHPLLVLFGVFAGEQMAGIPGAFLSVPAMAILRMVYRRLERAQVRKAIVAPEEVVIPTQQ
jgi:predicted PurR-regulated permease PerM